MTAAHLPTLRLPLLELAPWILLAGALAVGLTRNPDQARRRSLYASLLALVATIGVWLDFGLLQVPAARAPWDLLGHWLGRPMLVVDELSAPLLPLAALIYFLTNLATLRTKVREFSFARSLGAEAILLATLGCVDPWGVVVLLVARALLPYLELRKAHRPTGVFVTHMGLFAVLLVLGQALVSLGSPGGALAIAGILMLTAGTLVRSGIVPVHCWMTDLFEHATFGTALLFVTPMTGAYGVVRLVLPVAPGWVLTFISVVSLLTAVYAAGMALVQREARRFFCYLFLSHSSLVLVGLETATPIGLTGALSLWLSVALSLTGFGLTLRCIESRTGRVSLADFHGLYRHLPTLAVLFLLTGLASIGFPGTAGFAGLELLVEGALQAFPLAGAVVVIVTALNGLAVMQAYFRIFLGRVPAGSIDLQIRRPERIAVLVLTALILGGGLFPQPGVASRYHAAVGLAQTRARQLGLTPPVAASHTP